jgi:serine/threonine-protein kinase HipA
MAKAAGITMNECRLLEENGRSHFMTRRFDRLPDGKKLHLQSLCALAHLDFNQAGAHGYEQAFLAIRRLELPMATLEEQFRRMVFNLVARNQDDHTKNIAFLMNKEGQWSLAPAYDVTYSHNPVGAWTATHQMTINGKRDDFTVEDLKQCAQTAGLKRGRAQTILTEVTEVVSQWPSFADKAGLPRKQTKAIQQAFRLTLPKA